MHGDFPIAWNAERLRAQICCAAPSAVWHQSIRTLYRTATFPKGKQRTTFRSSMSWGSSSAEVLQKVILSCMWFSNTCSMKGQGQRGQSTDQCVWVSELSYSANYQIYPYLDLKQLRSQEQHNSQSFCLRWLQLIGYACSWWCVCLRVRVCVCVYSGGWQKL